MPQNVTDFSILSDNIMEIALFTKFIICEINLLALAFLKFICITDNKSLTALCNASYTIIKRNSKCPL